MSTNYYTHRETCPCRLCEDDEVLHIGHSSGGWAFGLHVIPERGLTELEPWLLFLRQPGRYVVDEYDRRLGVDELASVITRPLVTTYNRNRSLYSGVFCEEIGVMRSHIDDVCIGHGKGPWDLLVGDFS